MQELYISNKQDYVSVPYNMMYYFNMYPEQFMDKFNEKISLIIDENLNGEQLIFLHNITTNTYSHDLHKLSYNEIIQRNRFIIEKYNLHNVLAKYLDKINIDSRFDVYFDEE